MGVVVRVVIVPLPAIGVMEDHDVRESVIVVDYVTLQVVGECF